MQTPLRTARLTLRPARGEDLDALHAIFTDPTAMRYWDRPPHDDIAQTKAFLDHFMSAGDAAREEYIIDLEGRCIGKAGMWKAPEIGYILAPDTWGAGYAGEALRAILPRCFARFPALERLTAEIDPRNAPSARLLERLGFRLERVEARNFLYGGHEWCDTAYYALARPEQAPQPEPAGVIR